MLDSQVNVAKQLYLEGRTADEVSEVVDRTGRTVRTWLTDVGVFIPNRTRCTNINFFHNINTEEKAYWLGFIYADGSLSSVQYELSVGLSETDSGHLLKLATIFNRPLQYYNFNSNKSVRLVVNSTVLYQDLINNGIEVRKTYSKTTTVFKGIPDSLLQHFMRGYFDGDGTINHVKTDLRKCRFGLCGIEDFLIKVQLIIHSRFPTLSKPKLYFHNGIYYITYSSHDSVRLIYEWLYNNSTIYLDRKKDKFDKVIEVLGRVRGV